MSFKHSLRRPLWLLSASLAVVGSAIVAGVAVPGGLANTGTPTSANSTWAYDSGSSGPITVTVSGSWAWTDQTCAQGGGASKAPAGSPPKSPPSKPGPGGKPAPAPKSPRVSTDGGGLSSTDVPGHWAVGVAGSWNDSTTPYTLSGKAVDGQTVTLHVGNTMDALDSNYCAGATASNPYPSGTYTITHHYGSYQEFVQDTNGTVCVNLYDVHQPTANEENPGKNGDNTLKAHQYVLSGLCSTAQPAGGSKPPSPPASTPPSTPGSPSMTLTKLQRDGATGAFSSATIGEAKVGDTIFYEMVVHNTGNTQLDVTLSDPGCDAGTQGALDHAASSFGTPVELNPQGTIVYTCSHVLTAAGKYTNTAVATARPLNVSASVKALSSTSSVTAVAKPQGGVKGAQATLRHVTRKATPPKRPAVKAASFTG